MDLLAEGGVFVAVVSAVVFAVASPQFGDAQSVVAVELVGGTRFLAVLLVRTVCAIYKGVDSVGGENGCS